MSSLFQHYFWFKAKMILLEANKSHLECIGYFIVSFAGKIVQFRGMITGVLTRFRTSVSDT